MPLKIVKNDITKIECDAVVNAANETLLGGGGVDGAIHKAAGPNLLEECRTLKGCKTGESKITKGYNMQCKYIIHTVGPIWQGGNLGEETLLRACYMSSLQLALENNCESVAFPLISSGVYGYPKPEAFKIAVSTIYEFLQEHEMLVYIVVFNKAGYNIGAKFFSDIVTYIDDNYVDEKTYDDAAVPLEFCSSYIPPDLCCSCAAPVSIDDLVIELDESFSEMLLRKIDERGMKDSECYKRANIDRKLFSKIRSNPMYKPSKVTVLSFAIALELTLDDTEELLRKAGFALSHSNKFDVIVEYFIKNQIYNIFEINEVLFQFDQQLLGN